MNTDVIQGNKGEIEIAYDPPKSNTYPDITAVVCHPHPLFQGSMHNKVVTTISRALTGLGVGCMRFNYRGVGKSQGCYDNGVGEVDDALSVAMHILKQHLEQKIIFTGFSFGGSVAYKAAMKCQNTVGLLTVAPAVVNFPLEGIKEPTMPWCVIQGIDDEVVDAQAVFDFAIKTNVPVHIIKLDQVGHFFHGKLVELKNEIQWYFQQRLQLW
ncbi:alpha/beta hydrolase [Facilibium subflavum]|uniref:alpha/beta hydrolase n=1 Tax=Facilibium subflavum TaxID=2219058 RepID=UPI000E64FCE8|nr:alpha/beta hydrolase [Facilibium subflavum]